MVVCYSPATKWLKCSILRFLLLLPYVKSWNFTSVNLPEDTLAWRFALWRNRAFLAIPRWQQNLNAELTLIEAPWPEVGNYQIGLSSTVLSSFPNLDSQNARKTCANLQSVVAVDTDPRGRLWVLDAPQDNDCPAKIILYDLRRNDQEITRCEFTGVSTKYLRSLVVDPVVSTWGSRAYIGDPDDESIIVYSLGQRRWWRLRLVRGSNVPKIYSTDLAISRKSSLLYLTGYPSQDLFSVNLDESREDEGPPAVLKDLASQNTTVSWLGTKLGSSLGLFADYKGGLHYFIVTERASVRWDGKQNLKAENHAVLLQREDVPCITDYVMDSQRNLWGLVNSRHPDGTKKHNLSKLGRSHNVSLPFRTVKVYKYNRFAL
ncbi:uncharacterized protein LOC107265820 [Cephus cinctus]|uniref:Uncharacterized protein LOC107265820 n=1 Tax=Cephus cinctus TaxID=211228 RepID=A0AAJ7BPF5_CEPCN|nr:uncharacterized protein LOC107265820 [Cephus cinctus]XP_015591155.1 uncharacterized protein LOC107265820 [Cephus cinctus]